MVLGHVADVALLALSGNVVHEDDPDNADHAGIGVLLDDPDKKDTKDMMDMKDMKVDRMDN